MAAFNHSLGDLSQAFKVHFESPPHTNDSTEPTLSKADFQRILATVHRGPLEQSTVDLVFDLVDADSDGLIDYREYLAFFSRWKEDNHAGPRFLPSKIENLERNRSLV